MSKETSMTKFDPMMGLDDAGDDADSIDKNYMELLEMFETSYQTNREGHKLKMDECLNILNDMMEAESLVQDGGAMSKLLEVYENSKKDLHTIRFNLKKENQIIDGDENDINSKRVNKLLEMTFHCTNAIKSLIKMRDVAHKESDPLVNDDWGVSRYMPCKPPGDLNPTQQLITSLLFAFWDRGLKRYKEQCYEPIYTEDGHKTNAYKCIGKVENVMYELCSDQYAENEMWKCITTGSSAKNALKYLLMCKDSRFTDLKKNRYYIAFKDGVYCVYNGNPNELDKADKFYKYGSKGFSENVGDVCCCKYFDCDFPVEEYSKPQENWRDIRIPGLESVFNYQKIDMEVQDAVMQYFIGRILYDVGELDDCQMIFFILGRAGTGKSTILNKVISEFYDPDDVGVVSNNIEKKFGLGSLYDNFLLVAPEVKKDFGMDQAEFQSIASGEKMQLAIKGQPSITTDWSAGMMFAGNVVPGFDCNGGSVSRRLPTLEFEVRVSETDSTLGKRLLSEVPLVILKGNRGYLQYVKEARRTGLSDIWKLLPNVFITNRLKIQARTQGCLHFVIHKLVTGNPNDRIKLTDFAQSLGEHCKLFGFNKQPFDKEYYGAVFEEAKIEIKLDHTGRTEQSYVYGVRFRSDGDGQVI